MILSLLVYLYLYRSSDDIVSHPKIGRLLLHLLFRLNMLKTISPPKIYITQNTATLYFYNFIFYCT